MSSTDHVGNHGSKTQADPIMTRPSRIPLEAGRTKSDSRYEPNSAKVGGRLGRDSGYLDQLVQATEEKTRFSGFSIFLPIATKKEAIFIQRNEIFLFKLTKKLKLFPHPTGID